MFDDSFAINLAIFACGQLTAYLYLRTGRRVRGLCLMVGCWLLVDVALLRRFAFDLNDEWFTGALIAMQLWSLLEALAFVMARRRRWISRRSGAREREFRQAFLHYLRNELTEAENGFRRVVQMDAWDLPAVLALATTCARDGERGRARWLLRAARGLDLDGTFRDAIRDEWNRLHGS